MCTLVHPLVPGVIRICMPGGFWRAVHLYRLVRSTSLLWASSVTRCSVRASAPERATYSAVVVPGFEGCAAFRSMTPASQPSQRNANLRMMSWWLLSSTSDPGPEAADPTSSPPATRHCADPSVCHPARLVPLKGLTVSDDGPCAEPDATRMVAQATRANH